MKYVGNYIGLAKSAMIASAVSGLNLMYISAPGWGKSEITIQGANAITGEKTGSFGKLGKGVVFIEVDLSSPPELVRGSYNPIAALNNKLERMIENTPYDPEAKVVIVDEVWRGNDGIFDALVHATNNKLVDPRTRPIFWGTANFVGDSERTEALRDRFGLWIFLEGDLDAKAISLAHLNNGNKFLDPEFIDGFPTWDKCLEIRKLEPGKKAAELVSTMADTLAYEAEKAGFIVNPRRITQWTELLFRASVLQLSNEAKVPVQDVANFDTIPSEASSLLRFAFPNTDVEKAKKWAQVAVSIADPIGEAIEMVKAEAVREFRNLQSSQSVAEKQDKIGSLGIALANAQTNLNRVGGNDPRVKPVSDYLTEVFQRAISGKPLE